MRTTLDIEADILQAAKEIAGREGQTAGRVLSDLARRGLKMRPPWSGTESTRGGVPLIPTRGELVTLGKVRRLMDEEGL